MSKTKACRHCNKRKRLDKFVRSYRASDGYLRTCKLCHAKRMREFRTSTGQAVGRPRTREAWLSSRQLKRLSNGHK